MHTFNNNRVTLQNIRHSNITTVEEVFSILIYSSIQTKYRKYRLVTDWLLPPSVYLSLRANDQVRRFINIHLRSGQCTNDLSVAVLCKHPWLYYF